MYASSLRTGVFNHPDLVYRRRLEVQAAFNLQGIGIEIFFLIDECTALAL